MTKLHPPCRLCESESKFYLFVRGFNLRRCPHCSFVQVDDSPSDDTLEKIYSKENFPRAKYDDLATLDKEHKRRGDLLREFIKRPGAQILEVGCATGDFMKYVHQARNGEYAMWGVDVSAEAIEEAKEKNPDGQDRLRAGFIEDQNFAADFFDGIILWDSVEHLRDPLKLLTRLSHYLKPGGYFFISTPNIDSLFARVTRKYWPFLTPPEHLSFFSKRSLRFLFESKLKCKVRKWQSKGKWVNAGFAFYKLKRIWPQVSNRLVQFFQGRHTKRLAFYSFTGDVQYLVAQKMGP